MYTKQKNKLKAGLYLLLLQQEEYTDEDAELLRVLTDDSYIQEVLESNKLNELFQL